MTPLLGMLNPTELIVVCVILMFLFGAKKLPELARGMGKSMGEFKKARDEFEREMALGHDDSRSRETARPVESAPVVPVASTPVAPVTPNPVAPVAPTPVDEAHKASHEA